MADFGKAKEHCMPLGFGSRAAPALQAPWQAPLNSSKGQGVPLKFGRAAPALQAPWQAPLNSSKGQGVPLDFMAGAFIFLLLIGYFLIMWDSFAHRYVEHASTMDMELSAIRIADQLVSSSGQPYNWTADPLLAQSIGIAGKPHELDPYRISALSSLPYANAKALLGVDRDFLVKIETNESGRIASIGQEPGNSSKAVEVTRIALLNGTAVNLRVQIYER